MAGHAGMSMGDSYQVKGRRIYLMFVIERHVSSLWSRLRRIDGIAVVLVIGWSAVLLCLSLARYAGYNANMFDLGNMAQAIWNGTLGRPLVFTYKYGSLSRMALHVELIYWLIVPLYKMWPDPRLLLILQVFGYALGALPLYQLGRRHLFQKWGARGLILCYLFYPTVQSAVLFDFHGDTLAIPFLFLALDAMDRCAWRSYALWLLLALSCKFYVAVPIGALGVVLWFKGEHRVGLATFVGACFWFGITFLLIRPFFAPFEAAQVNATVGSYVDFYFGQIMHSLSDTWLPRLLTAVVVFLPALWLGWRTPLWWLPVVAVAFPVLLSTGPGPSYSYRFHHYALAVPFQMFALLQGMNMFHARQTQLGAIVKRRGRPWQGELFLSVGITIIFAAGLVDVPLNPRFWMAQPNWGRDQWTYGHTSRDTFKDAWLATTVPDESPIAASLFLAPHVTNRETLYLTRYPDALQKLHQPDHFYQTRYLMQHPEDLDALLLAHNLDKVDYVLADALFDYSNLFDDGLIYGGVLYDVPAIMLLLQSPDFGLVSAQDGLLWFERTPNSVERLLQQIEPITIEVDRTPLFVFDDAVALLNTQVMPLGDGRFRLVCDWQPYPALQDRVLFAVSRLEGVPHSRVPHLPTLALHPTVTWEPDVGVRETFDFFVPSGTPPGDYGLWVGWYDGANAFAAATDIRSRVGDEFQIAILTVK